MTYQIIYSSESAAPMQTEDLEDILENARSSNASNGITGALVYVDGVFLQILEGEKDVVDDLMTRIAKDVRHETVTVLRESEISAPAFKDWEMAYLSATSQQIANWAGLDGTADIPDIPDILTDLRQDPRKANQIVQNILSLLAPVNAPPSKSN